MRISQVENETAAGVGTCRRFFIFVNGWSFAILILFTIISTTTLTPSSLMEKAAHLTAY